MFRISDTSSIPNFINSEPRQTLNMFTTVSCQLLETLRTHKKKAYPNLLSIGTLALHLI